MPNWKKVILKDSIAELNQLTVSGVTSLASPAAPTTLTTSIVNVFGSSIIAEAVNIKL